MTPETVLEGLAFPECPRWHGGALYFSDMHDGVVWRLSPAGTVLQSYLYRTPQDLADLLPLKPNLRLVKGAYLEPASIAYPSKVDVDRAYVERTVKRDVRQDEDVDPIADVMISGIRAGAAIKDAALKPAIETLSQQDRSMKVRQAALEALKVIG